MRRKRNSPTPLPALPEGTRNSSLFREGVGVVQTGRKVNIAEVATQPREVDVAILIETHGSGEGMILLEDIACRGTAAEGEALGLMPHLIIYDIARQGDVQVVFFEEGATGRERCDVAAIASIVATGLLVT